MLILLPRIPFKCASLLINQNVGSGYLHVGNGVVFFLLFPLFIHLFYLQGLGLNPRLLAC